MTEMGWLFAVAHGLQERRRRAVLAALPIAAGHELSIMVVVLAVAGSSLERRAPSDQRRHAVHLITFPTEFRLVPL
jgi:hypothetical protein